MSYDSLLASLGGALATPLSEFRIEPVLGVLVPGCADACAIELLRPDAPGEALPDADHGFERRSLEGHGFAELPTGSEPLARVTAASWSDAEGSMSSTDLGDWVQRATPILRRMEKAGAPLLLIDGELIDGSVEGTPSLEDETAGRGTAGDSGPVDGARLEAVLLDSLGIRSGAILPLEAGGHIIGSLSLFMTSSDRTLLPEDLEPLREVARRIAVVLQNVLASHEVEAGERSRDGDDRRETACELRARTRQQEAVARLARCALSEHDFAVVMDEAVRLVTVTLDLEFGKVLEFIPAESVFLLRAGEGFPRDRVNVQRVPAHRHSQAGFTLASSEPVRVEDFREETRFSIPEVLRPYDILSGMSVVIEGVGRSYGVLGVYSREPRTFRPNEIAFVQTIADVLGQALERQASEEALEAREREFKMLAEHAPDIVARFDSSLRYLYVNSAVERTGLKPEDMIGKTIRELGADPGYADPFEACLRSAMEDGEPKSVETEIFKDDGSRLLFECRMVPEPGCADERAETALCVIRNVTEARHAEDRIRYQASLLDAVGEGVAALDLEGRILYWNRHAETLSGWKAEEVVGAEVARVVAVSETRHQIEGLLAHVLRGNSWSGELDLARRDGTTYPAFVTGAPIRNEQGDIIGLIGAATDLTERKQLEEQLRQAQKMEAVGRLAGGVAHDFNNLLTSIRGHADLLLSDLRASDPLRSYAEEIQRSSNRASELTRQLLAFSRKQVLQPRVIALGDVVRGMEKLLRRIIGEDVELLVSCDPAVGFVQADPTQVEQVVLNLAVNARDAMPLGGTLVIAVESLGVEEPLNLDHGAVPPGRYVVVSISDSGPGIPAEVQPHIFEPFFTTKDKGKGTGLGLSTVYGIVQQSGGQIVLESTRGEGTTFSVYLPEFEDGPPREESDRGALRTASAVGETLLIVEDEANVRSLMRRILLRLGYEVLEAQDGVEALEIRASHDGNIDLVLTDVIMPSMGGWELAERLRETDPELPVLFISGYTDDMLLKHNVLAPEVALLEKPFSVESLALKVRQTLDAATRVR